MIMNRFSQFLQNSIILDTLKFSYNIILRKTASFVFPADESITPEQILMTELQLLLDYGKIIKLDIHLSNVIN